MILSAFHTLNILWTSAGHIVKNCLLSPPPGVKVCCIPSPGQKPTRSGLTWRRSSARSSLLSTRRPHTTNDKQTEERKTGSGRVQVYQEIDDARKGPRVHRHVLNVHKSEATVRKKFTSEAGGHSLQLSGWSLRVCGKSSSLHTMLCL